MTIFALFATTPQGTEALLGRELKTLGARNIRPAQGGVAFEGTLETICHVVLWSRVASRLLLPLARFRITSADDLHAEVIQLPWEDHLRLGDTFAVDFFGTGQGIRHTHFGGLKVKDAIVDRFRDRSGQRPSVRPERPEVRIHCRLREGKVMIAIDLSGESLHRRGYRHQPGEAPLKENLAAAILLLSGWPERAREGEPFLDPMCGAGTLAIEAALMAGDGPPGLFRDYHGFTGWIPMDPAIWRRAHEEGRERFRAGREHLPAIVGLDSHPGAIHAANANAARAGLEGRIRFACQPLEHLARESAPARPGLLATNPPYGVRMGVTDAVQTLHQRLGALIQRHFFDWHRAIFTGLETADQALGLTARHKDPLFNGAIACHLLHFPPEVALPDAGTVPNQPVDPTVEQQRWPSSTANPGKRHEEDVSALVNRLRKNKKKLEGWLRKEDISCYRLYDADIPEFALAIDIYGPAVHLQEYLPPRSVDPERARERLRLAFSAIPEVLGCRPDMVFLKTRQRGQGGARYGVLQRKEQYLEVTEGNLHFLVNLEDRLDTGLFLDFRRVRGLIRKHAHGVRFLNLFGYTGTATVYAAAGGAITTLTVDLSNRYLEWAKRNMERNGFTGPGHRFIRADCLEWLARTHDRFDLILLDPPSFSNSKGMARPLNLQTEHVALILQTAARLNPGGTLLFATNFQRFKLDEAALSPTLEIHNLGHETLSPDFSRHPGIHRVWKLIRRRKK
ncbi:MAG: bifunctional 23S rRNA (guanine(2069)-N(7))-methyltransferase RlmK/23S rRNA (guanine(2445)-N(2))-methyltransferase RlmL [Magnetococcales bacterium]|nr:bifunctional 23S rRNA (guanine(2069)-N(7))-methyltransferase RlmK/23S rRNA (guanine(2445)-N(2))-methyltransferase RlmL [Magnetococcales bacterium]